MAAHPLLEVSNLHAGYGRIPILHGIDFTLEEGEFIGILGHNGMGKTTLLKTLIGLLPLTSGQIRHDGRTITQLRPYQRHALGIGYVPQGRQIFANLSVAENLQMGMLFNKLTASSGKHSILAEFPRLERLLDRRGGALSGGEQQLLALARCLSSDPKVILLDEPTEGIQPSIIEEIVDTLLGLKEQRNISLLLVEQNLEFLTQLSDRILLLQKGQISGQVDRSDMHSNPLLQEYAGFASGESNTDRRLQDPIINNSSDLNRYHPKALPSKARPTYKSRSLPRQKEANKPVAVTTKQPTMTVKRPTPSQLQAIVADFGMTLKEDTLADFLTLMEDTIKAYDRIDTLPDYLPPVDYPRTPGYRPDPEDNPLNAWYIKTEVHGAPRGPLAGKTIALKDNVCLAGVPMMNGASTLEGYTPDIDATIVTRILDAGGTIVGKAHCEYFCLSGGSHTNATGPVHNPHKYGYSSGGSSSGSGALVGAGEVDMAIGGDQGGSIRIPASFCGCYGMKPTHGLVPYTGIMPIELTIDHTGPITQTVADNALLLEVIAGADGLDPRQYSPQLSQYTAALGKGVKTLKIGIVKEGFGLANSATDVDEKVQAGAELFRQLGAQVDDISIPMHLDGAAIWTPIALEGLTETMMKGNGFGVGWKGLYTTSLLDAHSAWHSRADELSDSLKISMFLGEYFQRHYRGHFYAKAQNLSRKLSAAYDQALHDYDLLLMPTLPMKATPLPEADAHLSLVIQRAFEMIPNTAPFDATGHPAMSIPCGLSDDLPIGLMLVAKHWQESIIYQAAHTFEQSADWRTL